MSFEYGHNKPIFHEVSFSVRRGMKVTLMGQNGSGKTTLFDLITKTAKPESGKINISNGISIAQARQVISRDLLDLTMREFFEKCFKEKIYDI
ncbi:MAG: ATP-binding cassette domain-containing protein, partial [Candidatus Taylorbacteria bacterium]|nr:ATP-binding cassette domain-containing protein [Candidatus Taylorbacteria bacterium]